MPSSTPKQARTMAAAAHSPAFAKKVGIPPKVAKEYNRADTGTVLLQRAMASRLRKGKGDSPAHEKRESKSFERGENDGRD